MSVPAMQSATTVQSRKAMQTEMVKRQAVLKRVELSTWLPTGLFALLAISVWQAVVWAFALPPILLPSPWAVIIAAWETRQELLHGAMVTGTAAVAGFAMSIIVGIAVAALMSQSRMLRLALYPYVILLQTVPIVAIAPLLVIWSGYEFRTVVLVTLIISLFPIINSVVQGLLAIPQDRLDLFRLYGASRLQTLWRLRIPTAVNYLMLGAKTSSGLAVIGAIVAEFFVGNGGANYSGLGTLMTGWQTLGRTAPLMAALCISTLIGVIMFASVELMSRTLLRRWMSYD
jgi:NitT/TauT family transport system permease protein